MPFYDDIINDQFHELPDDEKIRILNLHRDVKQGKFDHWNGLYNFKKVCCDYFMGKSFNYNSAFILYKIIMGWQHGDIIGAALDLKKCPFPDEQIKENNKVISNFSYIFEGVFYGGKGDQDGHIILKQDIEAVKFKANKKNELDTVLTKIKKGQIFPLEVGTTTVITSFFHLSQSGALARWVYGDSALHLWVSDFTSVLPNINKPVRKNKIGQKRRERIKNEKINE